MPPPLAIPPLFNFNSSLEVVWMSSESYYSLPSRLLIFLSFCLFVFLSWLIFNSSYYFILVHWSSSGSLHDFSSFCLFVFLSFRLSVLSVFLSFCLFVFLSFRLSVFSFFCLNVFYSFQGCLTDWMGMGWSSLVIGLLRAPLVPIIRKRNSICPFLHFNFMLI